VSTKVAEAAHVVSVREWTRRRGVTRVTHRVL